MDTYTTAVIHDGPLHVGQVLDEQFTVMAVAVTDPRMLPLGTMLDDDAPMLTDLVNGESNAKFARVVPVGAVTEIKQNHGVTWYEAAAWRVTGDASFMEYLGPQAGDVVAATRMLQAADVNANYVDDGPLPIDQYYTQVDRLIDQIQKVERYALDAAANLSSDPWWGADAYACTFGVELLAMAVRDRIGTVDGWTAEAHDLLTTPYRVGFGPDAPGAAPLAR